VPKGSETHLHQLPSIAYIHAWRYASHIVKYSASSTMAILPKDGGRKVPGKIEGSVVAVNEDGNLVTDITAKRLADSPKDESVTVHCDGHETIGIFNVDHSEPAATFLAMFGSSGALELTIVGVSASIMLGIKPGEPVVVKW
jgi:S-adenosylmethionine hydrolase